MHDIEIRNRFIQLRSQGWSFARIVVELNVSKPTQINWSRQFQFEIQNLRAIELEALHEKLFAARATRLADLAAKLTRVEKEIAQRDLASVPTWRLFQLAASLRAEAVHETGPTKFTLPIRQIPSEELCEEAQDWDA